ncbi:multiple epidermal growth factor-like domains protein 10 [Bradysia coprophila]|uniref:multiple epidermal growth factor-like domains protein 10 n=1 Tax=Bradysia coprophila TaxID=38358 RepID=UPI00187D7277|nr:multiple epidermal growth factor-like domains protein 10 [Bradysia coprophila]
MKVLIQFLVIGSLASAVLTVGLYGYPCEENSGCDATGNLQCINNQCSCQSGFTRNMFDTCWRAHGEPCEWILDCNVHTFLKCNDTTNTCDCQQPDRQVYDPARETCVSRVGYTCSHETTAPFSLFCVENGVCDMPFVGGIMIHSCICVEGYRMTKDRLCEKIPTWPPIRP